MIAALRDDLCFLIRHAFRRPFLSLAVVATLAVSIAAASTAFGVATSVLWRPLPFDDESRLVFVWEAPPGSDGRTRPFRVTGSRYAAWRDSSASFSSMALFAAASFTVDDPSGARSIRGVRVSAGYFDTLGIRAALGRTFAPEDEQPGQDHVVILSHPLWQERFGARRDAIGQSTRLNGQRYTIVGVMPPGVFPGWPVNPAVVTLDPESRALWAPIARTPALDQSSRAHVFGVVARLAPGVTGAQAQDELTRSTAATAPDPHGAFLSPLREQFVRDARTSLLVLAGAALAVLLIACANLAALYVSAFESRRSEFATRAAIGAGLWRLMRQLGAEGLFLSLCGGAAGLLIARVALALLPSRLPASLPLLTTPVLDLQVAGFAVATAVLASIILTVWPITRLVLDAPAPRGIAVQARGAVYRVLVVSQIGVTVALTVCAGLLAQSLRSVQRQDLGFAVDNRLVVDVVLPVVGPPSATAIAAAEQRVLAQVSGVPGVTSVAAAYDHPLESNWTDAIRVTGDVSTSDQTRSAELRIVSPGYFETLDVAMLDGRALTDRDDASAPGAMVVNEAFARELGGRVLGRQIVSGTPRFLYQNDVPNEFTIVGVVQNERSRGLEQPASPAVYMSTRQFPQQGFSLVVRTTGDPLASTAAVRSAIRAVDPEITVDRPLALDAVLAGQLAERRVTTDVVGGFAVVALALAALGMYGLLVMLVSSRTREIGVRLALGASPGLVARTVIADSLINAGAGVAIGVALAIGSGRLIESLLVGVEAYDPTIIALVALSLVGLAVAAAFGPARKASQVDAVIALRQE
jgi:predicted permease